MKSAKNIAYVPINDPVLFRKHILLSNIDVIKILEKYESLKQIRNDKRKLFLELRQKLVNINEQVNNLHSILPEINKYELKKEEKKVEKEVDDIKYPKKSEGYKHLQHELEDLQDKLSKLNF